MDLQVFKAQLPLAFLGVGALISAVPIMMDHSPDEVAQAFKNWAPLFYVSGGLLVLYAYTVLVYRRGQASAQVGSTAQPARGSYAVLSKGDLIYATNEIAAIVTEKGNMRLKDYEDVLPLLERRHLAWHDEEAHTSRNLFLAAVRECRDARVLNGPGYQAGPYAAGDFKDFERVTAEPVIEGRRAELIARLKALDVVA